MNDKKVIRNGREYTAYETRNITAGEAVKGEYDLYKIKAVHNGLISKFFVKPKCYWNDSVFAGSFNYNLTDDKITWLFYSDYDPQFIFVYVKLAQILNDNDSIIVSVRRGRMIDRYFIKAEDLRPLIGIGEDKYGVYPVNKGYFKKLKPKVYRGAYAKQ